MKKQKDELEEKTILRELRLSLLKEADFVIRLLNQYGIPHEEYSDLIEVRLGDKFKKYPYTGVYIPNKERYEYSIHFYSPLADNGYGKAYSCSIRNGFCRNDVTPEKLEAFVKGIKLKEDNNMFLETDEGIVDEVDESLVQEPEPINRFLERTKYAAYNESWLSDNKRNRMKFDKWITNVIMDAYNMGRHATQATKDS